MGFEPTTTRSTIWRSTTELHPPRNERYTISPRIKSQVAAQRKMHQHEVTAITPLEKNIQILLKLQAHFGDFH